MGLLYELTEACINDKKITIVTKVNIVSCADTYPYI